MSLGGDYSVLEYRLFHAFVVGLRSTGVINGSHYDLLGGEYMGEYIFNVFDNIEQSLYLY